MLKLNWIAGAALISLGSLAFAQQQLSAREAAVDGSTGARQPFASTLTRAAARLTPGSMAVAPSSMKLLSPPPPMREANVNPVEV